MLPRLALAPLAAVVLASAPAFAQGLPRNEVDVDARDAPVGVVVGRLAADCGHPIVVDPALAGADAPRVTLRLRRVPWRDALAVVARFARCRVRELPRGVVELVAPAPGLSVQLRDVDLRVALLLVATYARRSIVLGPDVAGRVSLELRDVSPEVALRALVAAAPGDLALDAGDEGLITVGRSGPGVALPPEVASAAREGCVASVESEAVVLLVGGEPLRLALPPDAAALRALVAALRPGARVTFSASPTPGGGWVLEDLVAGAR